MNCSTDFDCGDYNDRCYKCVDYELSWTSALEYCTAFGGSLTSIVSAEQGAFVGGIADASGYNGVWIGLTDRSSEDWYWTSGDNVSYQNWHTNNPRSGQHCTVIEHAWNDVWHSASCSQTHPSVCVDTGGVANTTLQLLLELEFEATESPLQYFTTQSPTIELFGKKDSANEEMYMVILTTVAVCCVIFLCCAAGCNRKLWIGHLCCWKDKVSTSAAEDDIEMKSREQHAHTSGETLRGVELASIAIQTEEAEFL